MSLADKLQEQKNAGKLKIEDIYDFLVPCMEIFIKPAGRRAYFSGLVEDIPKELHKAIITEIGPRCKYNDDERSNKRWQAFMGVWVEAIPEWDIKADSEEIYNFEPLDFTVNDGE